MKIELVPLTLKQANELVHEYHRHNRPVVGAKFSIGATFDGKIVGAAIVGRPVARHLDNGYTAEVTRVVTVPLAPKGTNSCLYAACWRAWRAMGGKKLITYTLKSESGASLRGSGWKVVAETSGTKIGWNRDSRPRETEWVTGQAKLRWEVV